MEKFEISKEQYLEKYSECEDALANYNYSHAREILEKVLLAPDITVDGIDPAVTFDMIIDYALCLVNSRKFEEAKKLVTSAQQFLYLENIKKDAYQPTKVSLKKMWKKICRIYASCPCTTASLDNAINSMIKQGVELEGESYSRIAKLCRYSGNYESAFQLLEMASTLAIQTHDDALEQAIKIEREKTFKMANSPRRQSFESFKAEGGELKPGMIIGVSVNDIPKERNPLIPENMPKTLPFLIWEVTSEYVYAFPMRIARKRDLQFQEPIETDGYVKVMKEEIYRLPIDKKTILNIQATLDDMTLIRVLRKMYQVVAKLHTRPGTAPSGELIKYFVRKITEQRIAAPGDSLIIGKSYYYVETVDVESQEYVVVPINYKCNINVPLRFRIPFKHPSIFAIVENSEEDRAKIADKLSEGLESNYINTFCKCGNKIYLIIGEEQNSYLCVDICNQLPSGSQSIEYLPISSVNVHTACAGLSLADCFWQYHKFTKDGKAVPRQARRLTTKTTN